jgi:hypothetical protein
MVLERFKSIFSRIFLFIGLGFFADQFDPMSSHVDVIEDADGREEAQGSNGWGVD